MTLATGIALLRGGQAAAASDFFRASIAAGNDGFDFHLGLAYACAAAGDAAGAMAAADGALRKDPRELRALVLKADLLDQRGDKLAAAFYQAALKVAPPPEMLASELRALVARAQAAVQRFSRSFESRLRAHTAQAAERLGAPTARFQQSIDLLTDKRALYLQAPTLYYFPELPQRQFFSRGEFDWLDALEVATGDIRAELDAVLARPGGFEPYLRSDSSRPTLTQTAITDNPDWSAYYLWKDGEPVPEHAAACPRTMRALEQVPLARIPGRSPSVLFSLLRPGAHIPPHNGFINTRLIGHLPLIAPAGCTLRVGNETREWVEGQTWLFDDTIEHEAWNRSSQTRVVLLFEVWRPELSAAERAYVVTLFEAIERENGAPADWGI